MRPSKLWLLLTKVLTYAVRLEAGVAGVFALLQSMRPDSSVFPNAAPDTMAFGVLGNLW